MTIQMTSESLLLTVATPIGPERCWQRQLFPRPRVQTSAPDVNNRAVRVTDCRKLGLERGRRPGARRRTRGKKERARTVESSSFSKEKVKEGTDSERGGRAAIDQPLALGVDGSGTHKGESDPPPRVVRFPRHRRPEDVSLTLVFLACAVLRLGS